MKSRLYAAGCRTASTILCIVLSLFCLRGSVESARPEEESVPRQIVVLYDRVPSGEVGAVARKIVAELHAAIPSLRIDQRPTAAASAPDGSYGTDLLYRHALKGFVVRVGAADGVDLEALRRHPEVAFVMEDGPIELHSQLFQAGMERIRTRRHRLARINDTLDGNVDVDIAILDTGIDATHPDLNVYRSVSFVSGDATQVDPHGHGTHVAGIAAAIDDDNGVHGVAPGARLWAVKVVDRYGMADSSDLLSGLDYVAAHADEIDVVNMSLGGFGIGDDGNCGTISGDALHLAICNVVDAGVVVVASAGNYEPYGRDASLIRPASYDEVITVSAVIETDGLDPRSGQGAGTEFGADNSFARTFSNYGWDVDIAAPGVDVISTWPGGGYASESGTSMAAAHVSGTAGLWIAQHGKPGNRQEVLHVRDELVRLAFPQRGPDVGFFGDKERFAEPLLNVAALDPALFDPVEPRLSTDRPIYEFGRDSQAVVSVHLEDERGLPLDGIPSNGFLAYLRGQQEEVRFLELGQGDYRLTVDIAGLLPGNYDFTVLIRTAAGFERSAGCRVVIQTPTPSILIHELAFAWPVMNQDFFFSSNPLRASLMNGEGAPLVVSPGDLQATFSGDGSELVWSLPDTDLSSGVNSGITYGSYRTSVSDVHTLPLGSYHADLTVLHGGLSTSATTSFDVAYNDPALTAKLRANLSRHDFMQTIDPPALELSVELRSEWSTGVTGLYYLLTDPLALRIDGQIRADVTFAEDPLRPGTYLAHDVDLGALAHGSHQLVVHATDGRGLQADSNPVAVEVLRETGPCADPLASAGQPDSDGDGFRDECDNCPTVSNRSQRNTSSADLLEAELGDACKTLANLRVSSNAADNPDFVSVQEAIDSAIVAPQGVQIEILPGAEPYAGIVVVDRDQPFRLVGRDLGSGPPVFESSGFGDSLFEIRSAGAGAILLHNLVLRGQGSSADQRGISVDTEVSTELRGLRFEQLAYGLDLQAGNHLVERVTMAGTVATGVLVGDAALTLRYGEFRAVNSALRVVGPAARAIVENVLIVGDGATNGIANDETSTAMVELRHATLVDCGTAVTGNENGTTITHSILWDNGTDLSGVPCAAVAWSDLQDVDCGASNRSLDPLFVDAATRDYHLQATSPLLDHGPDPRDYSGRPCTDLDGRPRLRDHDGEGLAQVDPGAYERENDALSPEAIRGLAWTGPTTLQWSPEPAAVEYHVYRGALGTLGYASFGLREESLDPVRDDSTLIDASLPPPGDGFHYEITMENSSGGESTLGVGACAERSNWGQPF